MFRHKSGQESTLGTLYGDYSFPYQNIIMTSNGRIFGAEKIQYDFV